MQLMAYYESVKCFKYALINVTYDEEDLCEYAVAGGNIEIIHLIEQKGTKFDNCFSVTIKFNRNEIGDWLLNNYVCEALNLCDTVEYFNIPSFLFLLKNNINITSLSINDSLISAVKTNIINEIIQFLDNKRMFFTMLNISKRVGLNINKRLQEFKELVRNEKCCK